MQSVPPGAKCGIIQMHLCIFFFFYLYIKFFAAVYISPPGISVCDRNEMIHTHHLLLTSVTSFFSPTQEMLRCAQQL